MISKERAHFLISMVKSAMRMLACVLAVGMNNLWALAIGLFAAEVLGVIEEVVVR